MPDNQPPAKYIRNTNSHRRKMPSLLAGANSKSSKTGPIKALQEFRKRKEKKRLHTSKELRQYKKVMQQHGYEPGTGAKRRRVGETQSEKTEVQTETIHENDTDKTKPNTPGTGFKKNSKSIVKSSSAPVKPSKKSDPDRIQKEQKRQQQERHRALALRKKRTEQLSQKTSRRQPIMKNMVHDILSKLQKET
jgi:hypothetical protein